MDEIEALFFLDRADEILREGFFHEALTPVRKRFEPLLKAQKTSLTSLRDKIKIIPIALRDCDQNIFRTVAWAVVKRKRIAIEHHHLAKAGPVRRTISPQALVRYRDNWYVDAFCHLRNELRTFELNRIIKAEPDPGAFRSIPKEQIQPFFADAYGIFTGPATKTATIEFTGTAAC